MMKGNWELLKNILPETCWTEFKYESFRKHPLYVEKEQRKDFTVHQWSPDKPVGLLRMIRNYPQAGLQKLRSRSTLRVSLPLMRQNPVHHGVKCATVARIKRVA